MTAAEIRKDSDDRDAARIAMRPGKDAGTPQYVYPRLRSRMAHAGTPRRPQMATEQRDRDGARPSRPRLTRQVQEVAHDSSRAGRNGSADRSTGAQVIRPGEGEQEKEHLRRPTADSSRPSVLDGNISATSTIERNSSPWKVRAQATAAFGGVEGCNALMSNLRGARGWLRARGSRNVESYLFAKRTQLTKCTRARTNKLPPNWTNLRPGARSSREADDVDCDAQFSGAEALSYRYNRPLSGDHSRREDRGWVAQPDAPGSDDVMSC